VRSRQFLVYDVSVERSLWGAPGVAWLEARAWAVVAPPSTQRRYTMATKTNKSFTPFFTTMIEGKTVEVLT
jgi:hypothetical protein